MDKAMGSTDAGIEDQVRGGAAQARTHRQPSLHMRTLGVREGGWFGALGVVTWSGAADHPFDGVPALWVTSQ